MIPFIKRMINSSSLPIIVNPNAGLPKSKDGHNYYDMTSEELLATCQKLRILK
jgi:5-methyltetrahydrofolate--homocysteine methyltransferase